MSFGVTMTIDDSMVRQKLNNLMQAIPEVKERILNELGDYAFRSYQEQVPVSMPRPGKPSSGHLRNSVTLTRTLNGFKVYPTAYYARYVAYGTKPHVISARWKRKLWFWWERVGRWVDPVMVHHPGQKRNPFHARVYQMVYRKIRELVARYSQELTHR